MLILNTVVILFSTYLFWFFYYFSFNENFLLIFFLFFFFYIVYSNGLSLIMGMLDNSSLETYLNFKQQISNALSRLNIVRSKLLLFTTTTDNVLESLESFVNFQLVFLSFAGQFNDLLYKQLIYSNLTNMVTLQNMFVKSEVLGLVSADVAAIEFES